MHVQPFERTNPPQLQRLVNVYLAAVIPGWALSEVTHGCTKDRAQGHDQS